MRARQVKRNGHLLDVPPLVGGDAESTVGTVGGVAVAGEPGDEARLEWIVIVSTADRREVGLCEKLTQSSRQ